MKFFLAKNQKIKHFQFQIRIPHGIRRSPHPFSSQSDTSFARYGPLSVEVWGELTFGDGSTIIAKFYSFEKPLQSAPQGAPDNLWPENSYPGQYKRRFRILYGDVVRERWCSRE